MTVTVIDSVSEIVDENERRANTIFGSSSNVGFDIETTGLSGKNDLVTVIGLYPDKDDALMMLNKDGSDVPNETIAENLEGHTNEDMHLLITDSEMELLDEEFREFCNVFDNTQDNQRLAGFNAKTWSGGFDWGFLSTRYNRNDIEWYIGNGYDEDGNLEGHTNEDMHLLITDSEMELLDEEFREFCNVFDNTQDNQRLAGFNAKTWSGGFDWGFLSTRYNRNDIEWYIGNGYDEDGNLDRDKDNIYYSDIQYEVRNELNTVKYPQATELSDEHKLQFIKTFNMEVDLDQDLDSILDELDYKDHHVSKFVDEETEIKTEFNDLDTSHEILCGCDTEDVFDDSFEAVTNYEDENFAPVIAHCYYDIKRTICLLDIALEYSSASKEWELKDSGFL
jgi:DNA polymerase III epsilon subunit-like protein